MSYISITLLLLVTISLTSAALVCPGFGYLPRPSNCTTTCSTTNDTCPTRQKCCYRPTSPCGYHCVVAKDNTPKNGTCPTPTSTSTSNRTTTVDPTWTLCDAYNCDVDNDCSDNRKCCPNGCGSKLCMIPA